MASLAWLWGISGWWIPVRGMVGRLRGALGTGVWGWGFDVMGSTGLIGGRTRQGSSEEATQTLIEH